MAAVGGAVPEGLRYYVAMIQNVTARKRAESERHDMEARHLQAQKLESIGTLAGGIAHDFNNLLALMMGYAELAAEKLRKGPLAEELREIVSAGERAAILVDQLLAFSRRQMTQPEILNLNQIVCERHELLRHTAGSHIQVDLSLESAPQDVEVDAGQFERVLLNLVLNARDAMPEGGRIRIATRMVRDPQPDGASTGSGRSFVALTVADTGCGMDAETRARAFEPFFTTKKLGSGLGLASVYGIVKQSGGDIRVESELGCGTMVEILLPRASPASIAAAAAPVTVEANEPEKTPATAVVLVAENEPGLRRLAETILAASGYQVSTAADGAEAFGIFLRNPARFDVLLTDVVMPGMSGRRLADQIRQRRPGMRVVYMTSYSPSEAAEHGVADPNVTVLAKPFRAEDLRKAMERALGERTGVEGAG
jgi:nitrogen-specific signal transduction histidine kinase/ActR/RegA family two-component response regulator